MNNGRDKTSTIIGGILAILIGLFLIAAPGFAIGTIILIFASYLILYGIIRVYHSIMEPEGSSKRLPWAAFGIIAVLAGLGLLLYPNISVTLLAYLIAFYLILMGVIEAYAGWVTRSGWREVLLVIVGILSVILGLYLIFNPLIGTTLLFLYLGWFQLFYGVILVIYGFTQKPMQPSY